MANNHALRLCFTPPGPIRVRFNQTTYSVTEGETYAYITLLALDNHTFSFYVSVFTQDGSATCECHMQHFMANSFQHCFLV